MSLVGAGKGLCQHKVGVCTDGVGLTQHIFRAGRCHCTLIVDETVGIANPGVIGIPQVVRTPTRIFVTGLHIVSGVVPEPARTSSSHNHVIAHHLGREIVGTDTKALMRIARC